MKIELHNVQKRFGKVTALNGITTSAQAGARLALIGPNGSGKSTLLRAILGLISVDGQLRIDNLDPIADHPQLAQRLVYVPQVAPRLAVPVRECVRVLSGVRGISPRQVAAVATRLDLDLEGVGRRLVRDLSGGMRQKLLVAAALAAPAELLVLDEPTASLDTDARQRFYGLLDELPQTTTIILCSHRLEEVRQVTQSVWALRDGVLSFSGPTEQYLRQTALTIVDIRVSSPSTNPNLPNPLTHHGFVEGANGWWRKVLPQHQKVQTVRDLTRQLNGTLADLVVRDVENLVTPWATTEQEPYDA
ncbi:MAG: ABC transporter ATP-binding protein [Myxococcales bacterium]|nr:ABC transporter ATP-binding protein [Myxococcales bacterium]